MAFRDDAEAARARADALEQEVRALRAELARAKAPPPAVIEDSAATMALATVQAGAPAEIALDSPWKFRTDTSLLGMGMLVGSIGLGLAGLVPWAGFSVGGLGALLCAAGLRLTAVRPGYALVLARRGRGPERRWGYRLVTEGNALRKPGERIHWLSLFPFSVPVRVLVAPLADDAGQTVTLRCDLRIDPDAAALRRLIEHFSRRADAAAGLPEVLPDDALAAEVRGILGQAVHTQVPRTATPAALAEAMLSSCVDELDALGLKVDALTIVAIDRDLPGEVP